LALLPTIGPRMPFESILYVDDDPDISSIVAATLRQIPGLRVCTADSGERAIDLAFEIRPDLVLMDVMMPGLDGPEVFRRMHANALLANVPVIFMTAKALPTEIAKFLQLGAIGVIVKPFDPVKLYDDLCVLWTARCPKKQCSTTPIAATESRVRVEVDLLTASFLQRARSDVTSLAKLIKLALDGEYSVFKEIERVAHSIHGSGAMFGFPEVSAAGGAIARKAEGLKGNVVRGLACESADLLHLLELSDQLAQRVEAAWQIAPQSTAMFQGPGTAI
jgi:two-component system, OmpR family, response regulator